MITLDKLYSLIICHGTEKKKKKKKKKCQGTKVYRVQSIVYLVFYNKFPLTVPIVFHHCLEWLQTRVILRPKSIDIYFSYFSMKTNVAGTHKERLDEALSTHNLCFHREKKIIDIPSYLEMCCSCLLASGQSKVRMSRDMCRT